LPQAVVVEVVPTSSTTLEAVRPQIHREVQVAFTHIKTFCQALARGLYAVC
jgi:hypothetical protein